MKEAEYAATAIASFFADSKRQQPNPFADYERLFGIAVEDTDIMEENFRTLRALIKFIEIKLHS